MNTIIHAEATIDGIDTGIQAKSLPHLAEIVAELIGPDASKNDSVVVSVEGVGSERFAFTNDSETWWEIL